MKHEYLEECKSMIETAMFGDNIKSKFIQTINDCKTADRIKTNHKILNESFDFSALISLFMLRTDSRINSFDNSLNAFDTSLAC